MTLVLPVLFKLIGDHARGTLGIMPVPVPHWHSLPLAQQAYLSSMNESLHERTT
jgi:hypothetical protein